MTAKILVVDDEQHIRFFLERLLQHDGYDVTAVASGEAALTQIKDQEFDLAMLDVMMPGISGVEVMTRLHAQWPQTIVILLTAHAALETAVEALRHGAHDYLFKPCEADVLRKSIHEGLQKRQQALQQHALLKQLEDSLTSSLSQIRAAAAGETVDGVMPTVASETAESSQRFLKKGSLIIDLARHVITVDGHLIELSPIEFDLMSHLARKSPHVVSPQELVSKIQGYESDASEASEITRAHIYRIRQKIKKSAGKSADVIQTVRGVGYTISE
ncbi:response regulator transcription factor [Candidatus Leptofilum sp.]|uniref:response regulator transcription factor n=1 Tax=Candidatus Leptofilum sp. TaxID=3241576 RepID=UPI003B591B07